MHTAARGSLLLANALVFERMCSRMLTYNDVWVVGYSGSLLLAYALVFERSTFHLLLARSPATHCCSLGPHALVAYGLMH